MQLTLHATTRRTPHGASRLVQAMSSCLVKTRRTPSRHSRDARVYTLWSYDYGHAQTEYNSADYPPPPSLSCRSGRLVWGCGSHTGGGGVSPKEQERGGGGGQRWDNARRPRVHGISEENTGGARVYCGGWLDCPAEFRRRVLVCYSGGELVDLDYFGDERWDSRGVVAKLLLRDADDRAAVGAAPVSGPAFQQSEVGLCYCVCLRIEVGAEQHGENGARTVLILLEKKHHANID